MHGNVKTDSGAAVLHALGVERRAAGDQGNATTMFRAALEANPDHALSLLDMGVVCGGEGCYKAALALYRRALEVDSDRTEAFNNIGITLWRMHRQADALPWLRRRLQDEPGVASAWHNMGLWLYSEPGRADEAVLHLRKGLELASYEYRKYVRNDLALALFKAGKLQEGLIENEVRWEMLEKSAIWELGIPEWRGESLEGKVIVVHHEQGFGDTIQFVRFVPELKSRLGVRKVLFTGPQPLLRLLRDQCGIDVIIENTAASGLAMVVREADFHTPMMSVLRWIGAEFDGQPESAKPYLRLPSSSPGNRRAFIRPPQVKVAVALNWSTAPGHERGRIRSIPIDDLLTLAEIPGVSLYSIQVGPARDDLARTGANRIVTDLGGQIEDFADAAHIISQMDVVVTTDSGPAHLAGALGVKTWMFQPMVPCWRWCKGEKIWYGSMTGYPQSKFGEWDVPISQMKSDLRKLVK